MCVCCLFFGLWVVFLGFFGDVVGLVLQVEQAAFLGLKAAPVFVYCVSHYMIPDRRVVSCLTFTHVHKNILESWSIRRVFEEKLISDVSFVTEIITLIHTWLF